jgi:hypothetical protein
VCKFAASAGTGVVVGNAIRATTPKNMTVYRQIMTAVGMAVVEAIAANAASNYIMDTFDSIEKAGAIVDAAKKMAEKVGTDATSDSN